MIGSNLRFRRFFCVMNADLLAVLCRERCRSVREDFASSERLTIGLRARTARALRTLGEGLFRLGVSLDERVSITPIAETHV
jgi:hypothetical protein